MTVTIEKITAALREYAPDADVPLVTKAYLLAARAHTGQTRKSGEDYLTHPLEVAEIVTGMRMDVDTIATALLHDALEDNPITREEMTAEVGPVITQLVDGVTKIGKLRYRSKEELQAENFRKMMLAMSRDIRVILVKLADRLHNMRTLDGHKPDKQREISRETLEVYAPLANRLGLVKFKMELEDLCFKYLEPEGWATITAFLDETTADRAAFIGRVCKQLIADLAEQGLTCTVSGRAKHPYSIWRKVVAHGSNVSDIPDILAFRVILPDLGACYAALGSIHAKYAPIPGRIKDYIARSKPNGYQSLHTTVIGPEGKLVEVQFRTSEMHRIAEDGIAAHWKYKEGHLALAPDDVVKIAKIRELFEAARDAESATEFMETVKVELYADEVFVFTPGGDVKRFPKGATALDFAYAVHTDVGNHCTGAKVNGRIVPLRYELQSSDSIEILTSPSQKPNRDWLEIARTGRALQKIKRWLRQEEVDRALRIGRDLLEVELKRFGWSIARAKSEGRLDEWLKKRGEKELDTTLVELAQGNLPIADLGRAILPPGMYVSRQEEGRQSALAALLSRFGRKSVSPVLISGEDGVLVQYARCCGPLPGEEVVGFITRGRGITVHRTDCAQLGGMDADRRVPVQWDPKSDSRHSAEIEVWCADRPGLLAGITAVCEKASVNIQRAEAKTVDRRGVVTLTLSVRDSGELTLVMGAIERIGGVEQVVRVAG